MGCLSGLPIKSVSLPVHGTLAQKPSRAEQNQGDPLLLCSMESIPICSQTSNHPQQPWALVDLPEQEDRRMLLQMECPSED